MAGSATADVVVAGLGAVAVGGAVPRRLARRGRGGRVRAVGIGRHHTSRAGCAG